MRVARQRDHWLAAQQELRPPAGLGSTPTLRLDGALGGLPNSYQGWLTTRKTTRSGHHLMIPAASDHSPRGSAKRVGGDSAIPPWHLRFTFDSPLIRPP